MTAGDITWVDSELDDFRFLAGNGVPTLNNTYTAHVTEGATKVEFSVGGQDLWDNDGSDGWSATFDMSDSSLRTDLIVRSL